MEATTARTTAVVAAVAVWCAAAALYVAHPAGWGGDVAYLGALAVVIAISWFGVHGQQADPRVPRLVAAGLCVSIVGDLIETTADVAGNDGGAWLAAVAYFAGYLVLGAAVLALLRPPGARRQFARVDVALEAATVLTVGVLLGWSASTTRAFEASGMSVAEGALQVSTPLADLILVVFTARAIIASRGRSATVWWLAAGLTTWLSTGIAFVAWGSSPPGWLGVGWLLGMLFLALATVPQAGVLATLGRARVSGPQTHATSRMLLAILPAAVPPLAHLLTHSDQHALYVPYVGMSVLLFITLVRVGRLLASEEAANAEVARSRRYFRVLADNTVDAILVVDGRLEVTFCSRSAETFLGGFPHGPLLDRVAQIAPEVCRDMERALATTLADPDLVVETELELPRERLPAYVHARWVRARFTNLLADPDVRGIVISLSDASARKEAELELERSRDAALAGSRAKSTFLATMSHEIRTPLNGVLGLTELILTTPLDEQQSRYVEGVRVAGGALLQVINDVLDFSKIEAGRLELDDLDFDLAQLLNETAGLVGGPAQEKGLDLVVHCDPDLPRGLRGDHARLRQVLLNLASNAIKFTETGEVQISARLEEPLRAAQARVRFEVTDTGIGIDPAQGEHLFDAFTQADSSTTRRFGGTGLGLAISRQLVEAMGGTIGVRPRLSGGSRFWFSVTLPIASVQPGQPRPSAITTAPPATTEPSRGRVLVVEDSEVNQLVAVGILEHLGYEAIVAGDGQEAIAALQATPFDAVLMDCLMPVMDGYEATAEIRRLGLGGRDLPVIAMTASAVAGDRERCLEAGMNDYVTKPATAVEIGAALERWIPGRRRLAATR